RELARDPGTVRCNEFSRLLWLAIYSNALRPEAIDETKKIAASANAAFRACGSFDAVLGHDYRRILSDKNPSMDDLWDLVISSIQFTDAQLVPSVELSTEAKGLPESVWRYFARYPLRGASAYAGGASNTDFYYTAYLATHVAYIPTGYGRHPIYVSDSPRLYRFLRENFYAVLEMGELDLVAEFVDLFRQYGCTESNDLQLRDGTRYLLRLFHASGDHWMAYREPDEPRNIDDYSMIHKPWTGIGGVRARVPEPVLPGTYGSIIRKWLKPDR
ncbi:MAG TPA: hypothetical protein VKY31_06445, partial [Terriglobia bacterium]|nr:hypothetical protein [Terriglobia bacterium]